MGICGQTQNIRRLNLSSDADQLVRLRGKEDKEPWGGGSSVLPSATDFCCPSPAQQAQPCTPCPWAFFIFSPPFPFPHSHSYGTHRRDQWGGLGTTWRGQVPGSLFPWV